MAKVMLLKCPDCDTPNEIQLTLLSKNRSTGAFGWMFLARCNHCFRAKRDTNSIRCKVECTAEEFNEAVDAGIPCLDYVG